MGIEHRRTQSAPQITKNIRRLIGERGTSPFAVAKDAGIPDTSFYRKLDQRPHKFTVEELAEIAEALGVQVVDLVREE